MWTLCFVYDMYRLEVLLYCTNRSTVFHICLLQNNTLAWKNIRIECKCLIGLVRLQLRYG
jgi:hypothetical protein